VQRAFRNRHHIHTKDDGVKTVLPISRRIPLPEVDVFRKWLCSRFAGNVNDSILVINGTGENWKTPKLGSVILTACQPDIGSMQIKTFHRILLLREIASEYSVHPWVYILTLGDRITTHSNGSDSGAIEEKISETRKFLEEVFMALGISVDIKEDETQIEQALPTILEFEESLKRILTQMKTPEELEKTVAFGEKRTVLSRIEKMLLKTYLFDRGMLEVLTAKERQMSESGRRYSFISWGLEAQIELGVSYNIYDRSNAGAAILRKLVCIENNREYPGTIVLPDPLEISGKLMRYQVQQRDLGPDETLFLSDSPTNVKRKLVDQSNVSNEFLNYLIRNLIGPFATNSLKRKMDLLADLKTPASYSRKQELVFKYYWSFIKPYYNLVEMITCLREGLFIRGEFRESAFDALGSRRNRSILQEIATFEAQEKDDITVSELSQRMGFGKNEKRSLYRNLQQLERCRLVQSYPEHSHLRKYRITGGASKIILKWDLLREFEN
jgi:hypothetical protein